MFHRITCPACQHKFTVTEAAMGQRTTCPNCQSLFQAGKSVAEAEVPMKAQPAAAMAGTAALNKTMLAEMEPPIKYNCPRCKKPLESPSIEAGTKKPCPACGGRLQVPAAPKAAAPQSNHNKTILATDENAAPPAQLPPVATAAAPPPSRAAEKATTPEPARSPFASPIAIAGIVGGGVLFLVLLACVGSMFLSRGSPDRDQVAKAQKDFEKAQRDLEDLKKSIQQNEALMTQKRQLEQDHNTKWEIFIEKHKAKQRETDVIRDRELALIQDQALLAQVKQKRRQEQEESDRVERDRLADKVKADAAFRAEIASLKAQVDAQKVQAAQQVIVQPHVYYPPPPPYYDYRRYWPGW